MDERKFVIPADILREASKYTGQVRLNYTATPYRIP